MRTRIQRYFKTIAVVLILAIGGLSVLLYHTYNEAISLLKEQFNEQQMLVAKQTAIGIEQDITLLVRELELLSRMSAIRNMNLKEARRTMEEVFGYVKTFHVNDIALLDAEGINRLPLMAPHLEGVDFSYRDYFKKARTLKTSTPTYEFITFKGVNIGEKGIIIAMPIFPRDEEFGGVILFTMKASELIKGIVPVQVANSKFWVIDRYGNILYHPGYKPGTDIERTPNLDISFKTFLENIKAAKAYKAEYLSPEGIKTVASSYPVKIADQAWSLVIATPEKTVRRLLTSFSANYSLVTLIMLLVIVSALFSIIYLINRWNLELESTVQVRTKELALSEQRLRKAHDELEIRVEERTAELKKTNEQLQQEIVERKQAEEERKKFQTHVQEAQKIEAIGTLAGGIAHEFNNTLVGITGNIDLLQMGPPDDENISKYAERMKASALHMAHLTDQLLAYARGGKYQPKNISISDFVEETLPLIKQTIDPSIRIETDLPHDIFNVEADLTQMQMVLSALLINSAEAIEGEGRIRIITRGEEIEEEFAKNHPGLKPGHYVSITVEDDGKGMDKETRSRIFDPFFTTKFQGRGLGMAAVYGILINHGGWISVDSQLGKGTVVRMYLPALKVEVKEEERPKIKPAKGTGTILVIEDEDVVIDVVLAMLERLGYNVLLAKTGKEAVNIAKSFDADIDLAILDILLPDLAAKEVYRHIMEARPNLRVIVCSGYAIDGPPQEILDAGAQDFIQKPFSYATLSEKLKEVLEGK